MMSLSIIVPLQREYTKILRMSHCFSIYKILLVVDMMYSEASLGSNEWAKDILDQ